MIKELNILRVVFMLMIFLNHSAFLANGGYLGVACFFVLGGYCSTIGYYDKVLEPGFNYGRYALSKVFKFFPLHWLCAVAWLAIALASSQPIGGVLQALSNLSLVQSWVPDSRFYFSLNGVSWYLSDTLFFALIFPFLTKYIVDKSLGKNALFVILVLAWYVTACILTPQEQRHAILYISPAIRFVDFLLGVYLAKGFMFIRPKLRKSALVTAMCYVVSALCIVALLIERGLLPDYVQFAWIFWPLISVLIFSVSIAAVCRPCEYKLVNYLSYVGSYCFTFYMIHQMTIQVCNSVAHKLHSEYHFLVMIVTLAICGVLSFFCQKLFVSPVSKHLNKKLSSSSK